MLDYTVSPTPEKMSANNDHDDNHDSRPDSEAEDSESESSTERSSSSFTEIIRRVHRHSDDDDGSNASYHSSTGDSFASGSDSGDSERYGESSHSSGLLSPKKRQFDRVADDPVHATAESISSKLSKEEFEMLRDRTLELLGEYGEFCRRWHASLVWHEEKAHDEVSNDQKDQKDHADQSSPYRQLVELAIQNRRLTYLEFIHLQFLRRHHLSAQDQHWIEHEAEDQGSGMVYREQALLLVRELEKAPKNDVALATELKELNELTVWSSKAERIVDLLKLAIRTCPQNAEALHSLAHYYRQRQSLGLLANTTKKNESKQRTAMASRDYEKFLDLAERSTRLGCAAAATQLSLVHAKNQDVLYRTGTNQLIKSRIHGDPKRALPYYKLSLMLGNSAASMELIHALDDQKENREYALQLAEAIRTRVEEPDLADLETLKTGRSTWQHSFWPLGLHELYLFLADKLPESHHRHSQLRHTYLHKAYDLGSDRALTLLWRQCMQDRNALARRIHRRQGHRNGTRHHSSEDDDEGDDSKDVEIKQQLLDISASFSMLLNTVDRKYVANPKPSLWSTLLNMLTSDQFKPEIQKWWIARGLERQQFEQRMLAAQVSLKMGEGELVAKGILAYL